MKSIGARLDLPILARYRQRMNRRFTFLLLVIAFVVLLPFRSPAPLIYSPGEGWYYEPAGTTAKWARTRAKDQLEVAEEAFKNKDYATAMHAASRILRVWPLSDYAPRAEYLVGRCLEMRGWDESAFDKYQNIIKKYPNSDNYEEVIWRQYEIGNRFLGGEFFRVFWNYLPLYPSMDETAKMFGKIVNNGPYSDVAPHAQLAIGAAREKQKNYDDAVKAYGTAADRYNNQSAIASYALFRKGVCYQKQAAVAGYDQGTASQAIASFTDFMTFYPDDKRVAQAQKAIATLKAEQVRSSFQIAQFYENSKTLSVVQRRSGAVVYYNEVLQLDPNSPYAAQARQRIEALKPLMQNSPAS
ncbi:MAG TPA: outer membrane protein assembly factor BamD [Verrucomicrobiae bacterium]|jgi:outer membrane protein assembly factor BamD|nr:outer membrane protein assembly factor BamD [Verrucomicrobiae bacterium]